MQQGVMRVTVFQNSILHHFTTITKSKDSLSLVISKNTLKGCLQKNFLSKKKELQQVVSLTQIPEALIQVHCYCRTNTKPTVPCYLAMTFIVVKMSISDITSKIFVGKGTQALKIHANANVLLGGCSDCLSFDFRLRFLFLVNQSTFKLMSVRKKDPSVDFRKAKDRLLDF